MRFARYMYIDCLGPILISVYLTWFCTPFLRKVFGSASYSVFFIALAIVGFFLCLKNNPIDLTFSRHIMIFPVIFYMLLLSFFSTAGIGNASNYMRISLAFCLTCLLEFALDGSPYLKPVLYYILFIFFITYCTSLVGLITNPMAARTLTSSSADVELQSLYALQNIGDIGFIQSPLLLSPFLVYNVIQRKKTKLCIILWTLLFLLVLMASFTIALGVFLLFTLITILVFEKNLLIKTILFFALMGLWLIDFSWLFSELSLVIPNDSIAEKMAFLSDSSSWGNNSVGSRLDLYKESFLTFLSNPIGVGPYFFVDSMGIGNHSAILDDLARYGWFGLAFFICLTMCYYKDVLAKWNGLLNKKILIIFISNYIMFLLLNPGFRFASESVIVMLLVPHICHFYKKNDDIRIVT